MTEVQHSTSHRGRLRTLLTVLWALLPALTLGMGTPVVMIHAAARMRNRLQTVAAGVYVVTTALMFIVDRGASTTQQVVFDISMTVSLLGGTGHALAIRPRVWNQDRGSTTIGTPSLQLRQREALAAHADRQAARDNARAIVENDPQQAIDLRIGRPDVANRSFPDGGLIDINNVPAHIIAAALRISDDRAAEVVRVRAAVGGFSSVADLSVTMELPPRRLDPIAQRLIFLRPLGNA